jgi:hypothetical protein
VEGDAVGDGDAGFSCAPVGGEEDGSGGRDFGLVAVADQSGQPVVGEADGRSLCWRPRPEQRPDVRRNRSGWW